MHPDDRFIDQQHGAALRAGQSDVCEYRIITKQGQLRWMRDYARPIWDAEHTRVVRILGAAQDITKHKHAEATQHFLAEASKLLASSLDYETTLVHVAQLAIPQLADWCMIHLIDDTYSVRRVALTFADPAKQPLAEELQRDYPLSMNSPYSYPHVIRTGQPELIPEITDQDMQSIAHDARHLALLRALGFCSTVCVPLIARERTIGSILLGTAESGRRYGAADLQIAEELAVRVALAVDNARLFAERSTTANRLRRQNEELTALHDMALGLIDRLDVDNLLSALVVRAGGLLDTPHGYLYVFDQATNELVIRIASGIFQDHIGYRLRYGQGLAGRVWETGRPLAIENYQLWSQRRADLDPLPLHAIVSVPIRAGTDFVGVLGLAYVEPARTFGAAEIELLQRFADLASLALENARLYSAAQQEIAERRHTEAALLAAEANLRAAKDQAEAATRAKSEFLSHMSHDIRTPISSAIGITRLLEHTNLDTEQRELVDIIRISGDVLLTLVNNFLDLAKIEAGKLTLERQPFVLQSCIEAMIDLVAGDVIAKQIDLAYTLDSHLPAILIGDQPRLQQILINLLSNAVKFTSTGGILLAVEGRPSPTGRHEVHIRVADTGSGIPPERLEHVFTPFEQADVMAARPTPGTGLGLAIAKQLSELMGGRMWVESAVGHGSTFHFTICVDAATDQLAAPAGVDPELLALRGQRLLIVDRKAQTRHAISVYAQANGMRASVARTAKDALALAEGGARFDLAVIDLRDATIESGWLGTALRERYGMPQLRLIGLVPLGLPEHAIPG
jgi:signal transduction histidine kinase